MTDLTSLDLRQYIRDIPDFPKPGILFRDITPLIGSPEAFRAAIVQMAAPFRASGVDVVAAVEARGFLFAGPLALELGAGLIPVRKPGKLPFQTRSYEYELEYGTDRLEMHVDAIEPGQRVLVVDDLLATGGTVEACCRLLEESGGQIAGCAFLIELADLRGAERIRNYPSISLIRYG